MLLWSTGFIAAKYGLAYAPPLTFLLYRFDLVVALMGIVAVATRAVWPATLKEVGHIAVSAWLVHGIYLVDAKLEQRTLALKNAAEEWRTCFDSTAIPWPSFAEGAR